MDVTNRRQSEEALRELGVRLMSRQEEERKRVARELHDDLSQRMALLCVDLEDHHLQLTSKGVDLGERVHEIQRRAKDISGDIHRVSYALYPSQLDDLGLGSALNGLCKETGRRHQIEIKFSQSNLPSTIPSEVDLCVFRVAQEAVDNIVKHSGARTASLSIEGRDGHIRLAVSDSGSGFEMKPEVLRSGMGFLSMTERLRILDGDISISSEPSGGTQIVAHVPIPLKGANKVYHQAIQLYEKKSNNTRR